MTFEEWLKQRNPQFPLTVDAYENQLRVAYQAGWAEAFEKHKNDFDDGFNYGRHRIWPDKEVRG